MVDSGSGDGFDAGLSLKRIPKIVWALGIQLLAIGVLAILVKLASFWIAPPYPDWVLLLLLGGLASLMSFRLPYWWRWIQLLMPIGLGWLLQSSLSPWWGLVVFLLLWLVFKNAVVERVPLYLTNNTTRQALKHFINNMTGATNSPIRFIDLGCGLGQNVRYVSRLPRVLQSVGVETAPVPYLISKLLSGFSEGVIWRQDIWECNLHSFDLVYAFLSPEPMSRLWQKFQSEAKPGAVLISNSFAIDGVDPSEVWQLADARQTELFIYRVNEKEPSV
jgi:hypothetical protein